MREITQLTSQIEEDICAKLERARAVRGFGGRAAQIYIGQCLDLRLM